MSRITKAPSEDPRDTMTRLYGNPTDVDKVWEDREALYDAPLLPDVEGHVWHTQPRRLMYGPVDPIKPMQGVFRGEPEL